MILNYPLFRNNLNLNQMKQRYIYDPNNKTPFTLQDALNIQMDHLDEWSLVLKPEIFAKVLNIVNLKNKALEKIGNTNPESICRGQGIDIIVSNIKYSLFHEAINKSL